MTDDTSSSLEGLSSALPFSLSPTYLLSPCSLLTRSPLVWSNFEIADMHFWRSPAYMDFFEYLDSKGGFYYEVRLYRDTV